MRDVLIELLFPPVSLDHTVGMWLTQAERAALRPHPQRFEGLLLKKQGILSIDRLVCAASYGSSPLLREAVRRFKYRRVSVYGDTLGQMTAEAARFLPEWPLPVLCPVPLHWTRKFLRGFNQAELLAQSVAHARGWRVQSLLARTRATGSQARRSKDARRQAMQHAFAWIGTEIPERVVLIDDVVTSGATLDACASELREAGVKRVDAVTIAVAFT